MEGQSGRFGYGSYGDKTLTTEDTKEVSCSKTTVSGVHSCFSCEKIKIFISYPF